MEFSGTPQNKRNGMWVQVWVPLPDATASTTTEHQLVSADSNMMFDDSTTSSILPTGNTSPDCVPDYIPDYSSNSPESFIPSSYESSPQAALDSPFTMDDLPADHLHFPSPLDMPIDGELDLNLDFELDISIAGDMSLPPPTTTFPVSDPVNQFVDWTMTFDMPVSSTSPSTTGFASVSPSISSSHTPALLALSTPTFPSATASHALQSISPAPSQRPAAAPSHRCATCSKEYSKRYDLTKHEKKHIKPHRCHHMCSFRSADLRGLQRHMWTSHREIAERSGVPKQIERCEHPGCKYEGRLDNLTRHKKRHNKARVKKATDSPAGRR
ncbi:uncharacterized protein MKZ38_002139 [Zalerion maritima]|uniref:C2H2-type domain-containing protein n=1 Tax=Zalerion maritima TaxID=339359 RepID=A0AAD5RQQ9_9PEZI|nr:uncharacterized protein MKZ38_002139 [Zalerion maritima]